MAMPTENLGINVWEMGIDTYRVFNHISNIITVIHSQYTDLVFLYFHCSLISPLN